MKKPTDTLDDFGLLKRVEQPAQTPEEQPNHYDAGDPIFNSVQEILGYTAKQPTHVAPDYTLKQPLRLKRRQAISIGPKVVPPYSTVAVVTSPQILFRGEKLINTGDSTGLFIQHIYVGQKNQLPSTVNPSNPLPINAFSPIVTDNEMLFDTCEPDQTIQMQVVNICSTTMTFQMTILGA